MDGKDNFGNGFACVGDGKEVPCSLAMESSFRYVEFECTEYEPDASTKVTTQNESGASTEGTESDAVKSDEDGGLHWLWILAIVILVSCCACIITLCIWQICNERC